jgi:curved DNA-binding protein
VASSAGLEEIKRRYRHLAKQSHPDVAAVGTADAEGFIALQEAYRVLGDPVARERYDRHRRDIRLRGRSATAAAATADAHEQHARGRSGGGLSQFVREFLGDVWAPGDPPAPAGRATGAAAGAAAAPPQAPARGSGPRGAQHYGQQTGPEPVPVLLDLSEAFSGKEIVLDGVRVRIPAGARQDSVMRIPVGAPGGPYRFVRIELRPDPRYRVSGDDLQVDVEVDAALADAGGELPLVTPGGPLKVVLPGGIANGQVLRLRGRGLPPTSWRRAGDLLVRVVRV